jgi:glucose/mannose-6-phosphate isomerase
MGGSAIAGDLIKSLLISKFQIPFLVQRHYKLPGFVNKNSLVICSSYSGNTEETLSAYDDAVAAGAKIIVITTGGKIAIRAAQNQTPVVIIPAGLPPRAALGYSIATLLTILWRLGYSAFTDQQILEAAAALKDRLPCYIPESDNNPALELARKIHGKIPLIYAGQDSLDAVATRFKGQICENAECLAFANQFPEFNHNELVGWGHLFGLEGKIIAIMLRDDCDHDRVKKRFDIVSAYLKDKGHEVIELSTEDGGSLTRVFLLIQLVDYCSYYLALLGGVDPYTITAIDYLKEELSK